MQLSASAALRAAFPDEANKYRHRGLAFQAKVVSTPLLSDPNLMRQPQPEPSGPWQYWTGSYESAIVLWSDLLYKQPFEESLTGWTPKL